MKTKIEVRKMFYNTAEIRAFALKFGFEPASLMMEIIERQWHKAILAKMRQSLRKGSLCAA